MTQRMLRGPGPGARGKKEDKTVTVKRYCFFTTESLNYVHKKLLVRHFLYAATIGFV